MKCKDCRCMRVVRYLTYVKATDSIEQITVQKCFGTPEPFVIHNIEQECKVTSSKSRENSDKACK